MSHLLVLTLGAALAATPPPAPKKAARAASTAAPAALAAPALPAAPAAKPLRIVVGDFVLAGAAHPELARVLSDGAAKGVEGNPGHSVVGQSELVAILGHERTRRMLGCTEDQGCNAEFASVLDADRLVAGSLTLLDRTALVTVRFIDVRRNQTLARTTATLVDATQAELVDVARRLAHEAVTGKRLDTSGTLRLAVSRGGADVTLDGRSLGPSPVATQRVQEGPHTVTVQKAGYVRWSSAVAVKAGQDLTVHADLVPLQLLGESARSRLWTWGWASAGVAVAGGVAGVVFGRMADDSYRRYQAATERAQAVSLRDETRQRTTFANVAWGVGGAAAVTSATLLVAALVQDARTARELAEPPAGGPAATPAPAAPAHAALPAIAPLPGGAVASLSLAF